MHFPASLKAGELTAEGAIRQISENGMLFECSKHFEAMETGIFKMLVFDKEPPITLEGNILYKLYHKDAQDTMLRYGVRFTSLDNYMHRDSVERIVRFATIRERYRHKVEMIEDGGTFRKDG